ncbi:MAG: TonB C-terminal domain-containing protein [Xanthomonadales bacterium]|nr:TonB C-terminal domain-containing protein [Xanthomonadales bacterium]
MVSGPGGTRLIYPPPTTAVPPHLSTPDPGVFMKSASVFLVFLCFTSGVIASGWQLESRVDAMTDRTVEEAFIENTGGDRLMIMRRSDGSIWGFLRLGGGRMFGSSRQGLMLRVDSHAPISYSGARESEFEWNPTLVAFRMRTAGSMYCEVFQQLHAGESLLVRYYPSDSTQRDIKFQLDPTTADALLTATGVDVDRCSQSDQWRASVLAQVLERWEKPADIAPGTALSVMAKIDAEGRLLNLKWIRQSGTRRVDRSFINAFSEATRFAPPPAELDASQGVVFRYVEGEEHGR